MGKIIRQGEVIPVQAHRAAAAPVDVPPTQPVAGQPPVVVVVAPHVTPPPPPPVEVHHHHHHTTTTMVAAAPVRRPRRTKGTSFLGTLGFVVGALACGMAFLPPVDRYAAAFALAALAMAAVAWVGAILLRRVGAGMPFVGIVVAVVGYMLGVYQTGHGQEAYDRLRTRATFLPAWRVPTPTQPPPIVTNTPPPPPTVVPSGPAAAAPSQVTPTPQPRSSGPTLFGVGDGSHPASTEP